MNGPLKTTDSDLVVPRTLDIARTHHRHPMTKTIINFLNNSSAHIYHHLARVMEVMHQQMFFNLNSINKVPPAITRPSHNTRKYRGVIK
jgi:hypothetical protein